MSPFDRLHAAVQYHVVNSLGWASLRPIQEASIPPIMDGRSILLLAPTAGGKTEAAVIPILSKMLSEEWHHLSVLYVCPIKALLNNLEPRIQQYCSLLGRRAALWHGDISDSQRRRILKDPPDILLTTPESLEAMLISTRCDHEVLFGGLRAIIIDELHAFAGDDRGWHLMAVLERLGRLAGRDLQRVGLSATVGNPEELATWLVGAERPAAQVVKVEGVSSQAPEVVIDYVGSLENAALVISRMHHGEKRLVFCDSRARVELLAASLRQLEVETYVSHGSLGLDERRRAEAAFAAGTNCVIVATSTLELGLDVGDLDRVIQIDAPRTVSSFLQRMGRTGRRAGSRRNCLFLATDPDAVLRAAGLLRLWQQGFVEPAVSPLHPWHLFAQQVMALVLQEGGLARSEWHDWLHCMSAFHAMPPEAVATILGFMIESEVLFEDEGLLGFGKRGEQLFGRQHFMDLVSAFTAPPLFVIRHGRTELGQVHPSSFQEREGRPPTLLLGGRSWVILEIDWNARIAWVEPTKEGGKSRWEGSSLALHAPLCRSIRAVLAGDHVEEWLSNRARELFAKVQSDHDWCREGETAIVRDVRGRVRWWTFAGMLANRMLANGLEAQGLPVRSLDNYSISFRDADPEAVRAALSNLSPDSLTPNVPEKAIDELKFSAALPPTIAQHVLGERWSDLNSAQVAQGEPSRVIYHATK
ncbi:DEAD/DEAH box helicase [bacterium]|nr:DEAD/DEAH box helicase [bacterium]